MQGGSTVGEYNCEDATIVFAVGNFNHFVLRYINYLLTYLDTWLYNYYLHSYSMFVLFWHNLAVLALIIYLFLIYSNFMMNWFKGSVIEAIQLSKSRKSVFLVCITGITLSLVSS